MALRHRYAGSRPVRPVQHTTALTRRVLTKSDSIVTLSWRNSGQVFMNRPGSLIQQSQNKGSVAIHLKLNELLAAHNIASNRMMGIESLDEQDLKAVAAVYTELARRAKLTCKLKAGWQAVDFGLEPLAGRCSCKAALGKTARLGELMKRLRPASRPTSRHANRIAGRRRGRRQTRRRSISHPSPAAASPHDRVLCRRALEAHARPSMARRSTLCPLLPTNACTRASA